MRKIFLWGLLTSMGVAPLFSSEKKNAPEVGKAAPDFTLGQLDQNTRKKLSSFKGKVVLIDFWASWCLPCKHSLPVLEEISKSSKEVVVLAVNIDDLPEKAVDFWGERKAPVILLHDENKSVVKEYDIAGMPAAFVVDKDGILRNRFDGYSPSKMDAIKTEIKKWM